MTSELESVGGAGAARLRTAEEYRASLRDQRRVFYRGEAVDDVTTHSVFSLAVNHAAGDYEMAHSERYSELAIGPDGTAATFTCRRTLRISSRAARSSRPPLERVKRSSC